MRIAMVGNFGLGYKGTMAARALPLADELAARGHAVTLYLPAEGAGAPTPAVPPTVRFVHLPAVTGSGALARGLGHLRLGLRLTARALRDRPDVLYAFKPKGYAGLALLLGWLLRRGRLVSPILALDTDDWEGTGGWADREPGPLGQKALISWHERWCLGHADLVTAASRALAATVGSGKPGPAAAARDIAGPASSQASPRGGPVVLYLPNAAAPTSPGWTPGDRSAARTALGLDGVPVVLAYTRFVEFAPARLLETFAAIRQRVPTAQLVVAGKGLHQEEQQFAVLVRSRGLTPAVRPLGWVSSDALPGIFAAADLALYPLDDTWLNRTKCPMKLVDLLLAGVPVVADRVGQAAEYLLDGQTGRLVAPGNPAAMAAIAADLLEDDAARAQLGQAARAHLLATCTWREQAERVEQALVQARCRSVVG